MNIIKMGSTDSNSRGKGSMLYIKPANHHGQEESGLNMEVTSESDLFIYIGMIGVGSLRKRPI